MNTSATDRTPSIGRQVYLSAGMALARPTNLSSITLRSARYDAFISAAESLLITSCARAGDGTDTNATDANTRARNERRANVIGNSLRRSVVESSDWRRRTSENAWDEDAV